MSMTYSKPVSVAREYYNSSDADNFYFTIWGGEDIHIGIYRSESEPIREASRRTVEQMASKVSNQEASALVSDTRVIDIGAGYGGAARYLAGTFGAPVVALNLSEVENERNRELIRSQNLDHLIGVVDGSFEDMPYPDDSFDLVWSQDALLHSGARERVLQEVDRVLKPGGRFVFTDPMMADDCPAGVLQPILDRIHLETLGSPRFYREVLTDLGLKEESFDDHTEQLSRHYRCVLSETERCEDELLQVVSREYIDRMKQGLNHWIEGGRNGRLCWGIFLFRKR